MSPICEFLDPECLGAGGEWDCTVNYFVFVTFLSFLCCETA